MAVSARFKRLHAHDCCSHGRGDDHEVVGGTTTATEEEDDEEPEEEATAREAGAGLDGDLLGGIDRCLVARSCNGVGVDDLVYLDGLVEVGADIGEDGEALLNVHNGTSGGVDPKGVGPFGCISPGGPALGASGCAGGSGGVRICRGVVKSPHIHVDDNCRADSVASREGGRPQVTILCRISIEGDRNSSGGVSRLGLGLQQSEVCGTTEGVGG